MAIQSNSFGSVRLSGKDAARFIVHMNEDKPNPRAALKRGRQALTRLK
jgi:hypothetical protein